MRRERKTGRKFLAMLLCGMLCLNTVTGVNAASLADGETVVSVSPPEKSAYSVAYDTALADVGLPEVLTVEISTPATEEGGEASTRTDTAAVEWTGSYDPKTPGTYTLTASFTENLSYSPMPTVEVTVSAAEEPGNIANSMALSEAQPGTFTLTWSSPESSYLTYDADDSSVVNLTPSVNSSATTTDGTFAQCSIMFSIGGNIDAAPGDIKIRIPRYLFEDRDGNPQGTFTTGVSNTQAGPTGFYYTIDEAANEIVLTNYTAISAGYVFHCTTTYYCTGASAGGDSYFPSEIADGYTTSFDAKLSMTLDGTESTASTAPLSLTYDTDAYVSNVFKTAQTKYEIWQSTWGTQPAGISDDDYIYLIWQVRVWDYGTQPYTLTLSEDTSKGAVPGTVIGYSLNSNGTGAVTNGANYVDNQTTPIPYSSSDSDRIEQFVYYVIAYPRASLSTVSPTVITNYITATALGVDEDETAASTRTSSNTYTYTPFSFRVPGNLWTVTKDVSTIDNSGYLNRIDNVAEDGGSAGALSSIQFDFYMDSSLRGWSLTREDGADASDYNSYGKVPYTEELTDDLLILTDESVVGGERLEGGDYSIDSVYFTFAEYDYLWNAAQGAYQQVQNTDYASYAVHTVQYQIGTGGEWQTLGTVQRTASNLYIFTSASGGASTVTSTSRLALPEGATGVRLTCDTTHYSISSRVYMKVSLNASEHIKRLIAASDDMRLTNVCTERLLDSDGTWVNPQPATAMFGILGSIVTARDAALYGARTYGIHAPGYMVLRRMDLIARSGKSVSYTNDIENATVTANYTLTAYSFTYGGMSAAEIKGMGVLEEERTGTFYDLLPSGMTVDPSSVQVYCTKAGAIDAARLCDRSIELVENWEGSGRVMMIVHASVPDDVENYYVLEISAGTNFLYTGFSMTYKAYYPWDEVQEYGRSPRNSFAYQYDGNLGDGYSVAADNGTGKITDGGYFVDLDDDGNPAGTPNNTVYAQTSTPFSFDTSAELSFSKKVKTAADSSYTMDTEAIAGGTYTYRLRTASSEGFVTSGIVFYDSLETYLSAENPSGRWKGTLASVDTSYAEAEGADVVVYYSTVEGLDFTGAASIPPLTDTSVWTTTAPSDLSAVTALAFDLTAGTDGSPFELEPRDSIYVTITMRAPTEGIKALEESGALAINTAWQTATTQSVLSSAVATTTEESQYTEVSIRTPEAGIYKASAPASGTEASPQAVEKGSTLTYDIRIVNEENAFTLKDVVATDTIPDGLMVDTAAIQWYSGANSASAALVSESSRVSVAKSGQTLTFTMAEMLIGETIHFLIPTTVMESAAVINYVNSATLVEINDVDCEITSEPTYHVYEIPTGSLTVSNAVSGNAADTEKEFTFTVTLGDVTIQSTVIHGSDVNGTYGDMEFVNGVATFTLKDGESVTATGLLDGIPYTVTERDYTADGYVTEKSVYEGAIVMDTTATAAFMNIRNLVGLTFTKVDEDSNPLAGVEFSLYDSNGNEYATATSAGDGTVTFNGLQLGTYTLKETKAPTGYVLGADQSVAIPAPAILSGDNVALANVTNTLIRGSITFTKVDKSGNPLAGAEFTLYDSNGETYATAASAADGIVLFTNVLYGDYTIKETKAPTGYLLNGAELTASVTANGETVTASAATVVDETDAAISVTKTTNSIKVKAREEITYTITVTNSGTNGIDENVVVTEQPDTALLTYKTGSANPSVGTYDEATGVWTISTLEAGAKATLKLTFVVSDHAKAGDTVTNALTVAGPGDIVAPNPVDSLVYDSSTSTVYYYRIDYVYTRYEAAGTKIYSNNVTGSVQTTNWSTYFFTADNTAIHSGYTFSLASSAFMSGSLIGTTGSNPYVFTVYYKSTAPETDKTPARDVPDTGDPLSFWLLAAATSGTGLIWLFLTGRKRRKNATY